ncbi:hypothetical protein GY45DRAFT_1328988 [Cubamyces sp. BRFM 1775]|nr:hypothetical protein GY45DRAFT_1328988 [Cubamyces sp. BRFM 1775]
MSTALPDSPGLPALHRTLGALLLGTTFGLIIYGVTLLQAYRYFRLYPRDPYVLKALVVLVLMMDTTTSAFGIYTCYYTMVVNFLRAEVLLYSTWSIDVYPVCGGLAMVSCQSFFAWRVWRVAPKLRPLVVVAGGLSIAELAVLTASTIHIFAIPLLADMRGAMRIMALGSLLGVTADLLLTALLIVTLTRSRTGFNKMDSKIRTIIMYSFNTGLLTGLCNLFFVVSAFTMPETLYPVAAAFIGFKMYATTLLAALNVRQSSACRCGVTTPSVNLVFGSGCDRAPAHTGTVSMMSGTRVGSCQWEAAEQLEASRDEMTPIALMSKPKPSEEVASTPNTSTKVTGSFAVEGR